MSDPEKPISKPEDFYGQKTIVRKIFSRIGAERPQSVAIIGGRKIGKTSLLNYLASETVYRNFLGPNYQLYYERLNLGASLKASDFISNLSDSLKISLLDGETPYARLQRGIDEIHRQGTNLIFLFDDFHFITQNSGFPLEFFSFLRSLANNFNVAYVTSSFLELQKLCVAKDIEESPFFNIFTNLSLGFLEEEEAVSLLINLTGWPQADAHAVISWLGPHPYLIKILAQQFRSVPPKKESLSQVCMPFLSHYFTDIVSILSPEAFKALKELAKGKVVAERDQPYLKPLLRHRFLEEESGIIFFAEAFRQFIQNDLKTDMLKGKNHLSRS